MKEIVAVIDGGGRGAALVEGYGRSEYVDEVVVIPGNDLMPRVTEKNVKIYPELKTTDVNEIVKLCKEKRVALVDVAQDDAVAAGLVNVLKLAKIRTVGPMKLAGQIEWSKVYSRQIGNKVGLLQPKFWHFGLEEDAIKFLEKQSDQRWFIKADGLAGGKGALPAKSGKDAMERVMEIKRYKNSSERFLLEEWLVGDNGEEGEEFSAFYISDGKNFKHLGNAQDHKRALDFDEGENTGGMGCSSPPLVLTPELQNIVETEIVEKILKGLRDENRPYKGVLYVGGMLIKRNGALKPYVIEFNARWGDPEAEVLIPGLRTDLFELGVAVADGKLDKLEIRRDNKARVVVAGVSRRYPGNYGSVLGREIFGLEEAMKVDGVKVYGAAVEIMSNRYYANGGRLFHIVGEGENVIEARKRAYEAMSLVYVDGNNLHYRTDIGWRDVQRLRIQSR